MSAFPRKKLTEYFDLEERRLKLKREAESLAKQQAAIEKEVEEYVTEDGAELNKYGFLLYFKDKRKAVLWKEEFVKVKGDKAAEALIAAMPVSKELVIERTTQ
jgi:hypothetical protein